MENSIPDVDLGNFDYELPDNRIAAYPLEQRESSKLLVYRNSKIEHHCFKEISDLIPENSLLVFNETRVIPARLTFKKDTGAVIEIFLIMPVWPDKEVSKAMKAKKKCIWSCLVGNFKKWKNNQTLSKNIGDINSFNFQANIANREVGHIKFSWNTDISFAECIEVMGKVPLPPYIKRKPENSDKERYQTIYSHNPGAVAAPTAGLH
ncbi:MAG: S-adenosylmethionine:tRNA ribosyltransferase-isomerase, partial [Bacteroidetes bacterium]